MSIQSAALLLVQIWAGWACLQLGLFVVGALLIRPRQPCFNGFAIHMPGWLYGVLTPDEIQAVYEHECGHRARGHVWVNLAKACCFLNTSSARRLLQELEADDYARRRGFGVPLASALRKLSRNSDDRARADRIAYLAITYPP